MRLHLDLQELHVETTAMQPEASGFEGFEAFDGPGGMLASVLYDTQTRPIIRPNTNSSPCIA
jgi:hypothetical protein